MIKILNFCYVLLVSATICNIAYAQQTDTLSLDQAIALALDNNHLIHIKKLQTSERVSKIKEATVKRFPALLLNSTYQYNPNIGQLSIPSGSFGTLPLGGTLVALPSQNLIFPLSEHITYNIGATAYQPITQLWQINTGVELAKTEHSIATIEQRHVALKIQNSIEKLYYGILVVRKRQEEALKNIDVAKLKLHDVQSALLSGKTIDVNEAGLNANIAKEEQELLKLKFEEEDYISEFRKLINLNVSTLNLKDDDTTLKIENNNLDSYLTDAEKNNIDMQLSKLQKKKSDLGLKAAKQGNLPEFGIMAGYTYQKGNMMYPNNNPFIGGSFKWNIQDLFSNGQVIKQRKLLQQQANENELYTKQQTSVAIEEAYRKMKQAEKLISVAKRAVFYRKKELKIEQDRAVAGLTTQEKVLETEASLAKAEADFFGAKQSYKVALGELKVLTNNY